MSKSINKPQSKQGVEDKQRGTVNTKFNSSHEVPKEQLDELARVGIKVPKGQLDELAKVGIRERLTKEELAKLPHEQHREIALGEFFIELKRLTKR